MPYESVWVNKTDRVEISRSGYLEFPYMVGRFYKESNEPYGYSPAMHALPWVKLLNAQAQTVLRAAMKQADPPLLAPNVGFMLPFNLNPGYTNLYDPTKSNYKDFGPILGQGNIPITVEIMQMVQTSIEKAFFVPLFRSISDITKQMTVPEVQRRIAESMVLLGPVVGRFTQEVITPCLERTFRILYRRGDIPQPPEAIQDQELGFNFLGQLAKAQKMSEMNSVTNFLTISSSIASVKPDALDKINTDKVIDNLAEIEGIDPEMLNSDEQVEAIRKQREEIAAQQMQLAMMQQGAGVAKDFSAANKNMQDSSKDKK